MLLDGFASLHAGYDQGSAITRPVILDGRRLSLNLSTSASGFAKVFLLAADVKELPGFDEAEALVLEPRSGRHATTRLTRDYAHATRAGLT